MNCIGKATSGMNNTRGFVGGRKAGAIGAETSHNRWYDQPDAAPNPSERVRFMNAADGRHRSRDPVVRRSASLFYVVR